MPTPRDFRRIHQEAFVVDSHVDTVGRMLDLDFCPGQAEAGPMQVDANALRRGNVGLLFCAAFIPPDDRRPTWRAFSIIERTRKFAAAHPKRLAIAVDCRQIAQARRSGQTALVHSLENGGDALDGNLELIEPFYTVGVRCFGIVWNAPNCLATGVGQPKTLRGFMGRPRSRKGLTPMGKKAIRLLNRRGMLVDVSHLNDAGLRDVIRLTDAPIVATHSNAYALCKVIRNQTDEQLQAIAGTGGVIGVNFVRDFLALGRETSVADVVDHIEYIASLVGVDHVGLGTDFDGCLPPADLADAGRLPQLTRELVRRGVKTSDIKKILGGNFMRVFRQGVG